MTVTVRLDRESEARLDRLARRRGVTRSHVLRQALEALARQDDESSRAATSLYERWAPLLGCVHGGDPTRSERTGERFRRLLLKRKQGS